MIRENSRGNQATKRLMNLSSAHWMHQFLIIESIKYIEFPEESVIALHVTIFLFRGVYLSLILDEPYSLHETLSSAFSQFKSLNPILLKQSRWTGQPEINFCGDQTIINSTIAGSWNKLKKFESGIVPKL